MMTTNVKCVEGLTSNHYSKVIKVENTNCVTCDKCTGCSNLVFAEDPITTRKTAICTKMRAAISRNINSTVEMYNIQKPVWCTDNISSSSRTQDVSLALFISRTQKM